MARRKKAEAKGAPEWMVTFGDMMSLLLTFFIMLYSMSVLETEKTLAVVESLRQQFGHNMTPQNQVPGPAPPANSAILQIRSMGRDMRQDTVRGGNPVKSPTGSHARVRSVRPAEKLQGGTVYFDIGSDELSDQAKKDLMTIYKQIAGFTLKIEVRGHTSPAEPSHYRNLWDLGYTRAYNVMTHLTELGVKPKRFRLSSVAQYEPVAKFSSPDQQNQDAFVEVMLLEETTEELEGDQEERRKKYLEEGPI